MKTCVLWLLLSLAVAVSYGQEEEHHKFREQYEAYKKEHNKDHHPSEHDMRLKLWVARHKFIEEHNASGKHPFTLGHNELSDLTEEEKEHLAGYRPHSSDNIAARAGDERRVDLRDERIDESRLPKSFDWRKQSTCIGPIKAQSPCASCWAFATMALVEFSWCRKENDGAYDAFSEQDLVDCSERDPTPNDDKKCKTFGNTRLALKYLVEIGGPSLATDYPYVGPKSGGRCKKRPTVGSVVRYGTVPDNVAAMKSAIMKYGPIKAGIYTGDAFGKNQDSHKYMHYYKDGVYSTKTCMGKKTDHAITIIGWGTSKDGIKYWLIRNSWGKKWGEQGYLKMERGVNMCGIESSYKLYAVAGSLDYSRHNDPGLRRHFRNETIQSYQNHGRPVRLNSPPRSRSGSNHNQRPTAVRGFRGK